MRDDIFSTLSSGLMWLAIAIIIMDGFKACRRQYIVTEHNAWEDPILQKIGLHQCILVAVVMVTSGFPIVLYGIGSLTSDLAFLMSLFISLLCMDVSQQFTHRINRLITPVPQRLEYQ